MSFSHPEVGDRMYESLELLIVDVKLHKANGMPSESKGVSARESNSKRNATVSFTITRQT